MLRKYRSDSSFFFVRNGPFRPFFCVQGGYLVTKTAKIERTRKEKARNGCISTRNRNGLFFVLLWAIVNGPLTMDQFIVQSIAQSMVQSMGQISGDNDIERYRIDMTLPMTWS